MLERTFCHVPGIGSRTEQRLWAQGADCWQTFLAQPGAFRVPRPRLAPMLDTLNRSCGAVGRGDHRFFLERLPSREHWRALHAFPGRVVYLDIETDGGTECDSVTVIGASDGTTLRQFVRGENLLDFPEMLEDTALLVTFFGGGFDVPVLKNAFPRLRFDCLHLDLCPTLRRLELRGGLKKIETYLGIRRPQEIAGLDGWDAVRLWRDWRRGREASLRTLLAYNAADVENLVPLARFAFSRLEERSLALERAG